MENELKHFIDNAFTFGLDFEEPADSEEDQIGFYWLIQKFEDMLYMSFSLPEHDDLIITYSSDKQPLRGLRTMHCPIRSAQQRVPNWKNLSPEVREAIRRGFRRGVGRLFKLERLDVPENWESHRKTLGDKAKFFLEMVKERTIKARHYGSAQKSLTFIINEAFNSFEYVPHHPEFDQAFKSSLVDMPLNEINNYVQETCLFNSLNTEAGVDYLKDLATEVAELHWQNQPSKLERVKAYLAGIRTKGIASSPFALSQLAPTHLAGPGMPATANLGLKKIKNVSELCVAPFTPTDLASLLQYLGLLDANGENLTIQYKGKKRAEWGKFTAAYRVLHRMGLMNATANDNEWAAAFKSAYQTDLKTEVCSHTLAATNRAKESCTLVFKKSVEDAFQWAEQWKADAKGPKNII